MLVQPPVAGDTRVLREAATLVADGHRCTSSAATSRRASSRTACVSCPSARSSGLGSAARVRSGPAAALVRLARWICCRSTAGGSRAPGAVAARRCDDLPLDVVHAHDFNALEPVPSWPSCEGVPLVYDSHEFWTGRPRAVGPPRSPASRARAEARLGGAPSRSSPSARASPTRCAARTGGTTSSSCATPSRGRRRRRRGPRGRAACVCRSARPLPRARGDRAAPPPARPADHRSSDRRTPPGSRSSTPAAPTVAPRCPWRRSTGSCRRRGSPS